MRSYDPPEKGIPQYPDPPEAPPSHREELEALERHFLRREVKHAVAYGLLRGALVSIIATDAFRERNTLAKVIDEAAETWASADDCQEEDQPNDPIQ